MVTAPVRREVVREMVARGLSERRALAVGRMSASAFRYVPRPDGNAVVRDRIVDLAQRHRRYGAGMIYLKLRQAGHVINHTRVDRLYTEARLQLKRRRRKTIPIADRQPLVRPERRNQVWSADFVFDRTADGRVMKCLTIVDDATHEAVAIVPARAFGGLPVTRVLDRLAITRGLPQILRTACGALLSHFVLFPWVWGFLTPFRDNTQAFPLIQSGFSLYAKLLLTCGLAVQLPATVLLLARVGAVTPGFLVRNIGYAAVVVVTVAAILTPTHDLVTLTLTALPLFVVYVLCVLIAWGFAGSSLEDPADPSHLQGSGV